MSYIVYVIDTETTGLNAKENDVIECSMLRFSFDNAIAPEQKTWLIRAVNAMTIQDEALAINGHKREDILCMTKFGKENYKNPADVIIEIERWILSDEVSAIDRVFAGQNPKFDIDALQEMWKRENALETFPFAITRGDRVLDTKQLALLIDLCTGQRRRYYNLGSLVEAFSAKKSKAHTAAGDVEMTADVLRRLIDPLKEFVSEKFKDFYCAEKLDR